MEDFKDVMLSEPPAAVDSGLRAPAYAPYTAPAPAGGSFENYKGILLCDRPADHKAHHGGADHPFLPPGAAQDSVLGLQPSQEALKRHDVARRILQNKKVRNTAQHQHRRMLKGLEAQKLNEKLGKVEKQIEDDVTRGRFQAQQQRYRQQVLGMAEAADVVAAIPTPPPASMPLKASRPPPGPPSEESDISDPPSIRAPGSLGSTSLPPVPPPPVSYVASPRTPASAAASSTSSKRKKKPKEKPRWAMTEEEVFDAELKETDDLIEFAQGLDFEKYLDDYEIREALSIMRERVEELKDEEQQDQDRRHRLAGDDYDGGEGTRPAAPQSESGHLSVPSSHPSRGGGGKRRKQQGGGGMNREHDQMERDWDNYSSYSTLSDRKRKLIEQEAVTLAEKILQGSPGLRGVHSKHSLGRVLEELTHKTYNEEKNKFRAGEEPRGGVEAGHQESYTYTGPPVQQPQVAMHSPNESGPAEPKRILRQLQKSKTYVQNLPYLYRCPSI